jgi:hypothetical protein
MDGFEANEGIIIIAAPTGPTCSTRRCCARAASTARSSFRARHRRPRADPRVHMKKVPLAPDVDRA